MRLAYLGSPAVAVEPLRALVAAGHDVAMVVTNADKRRGRGSKLVPTPVKEAALGLGLPVTDRVLWGDGSWSSQTQWMVSPTLMIASAMGWPLGLMLKSSLKI